MAARIGWIAAIGVDSRSWLIDAGYELLRCENCAASSGRGLV
ncbi:hypothetical protein RESH_03485 [Rhodopirellula europaea SH398]|uniref:Uncharacterized protein n=1 Tax=Rhodopirellula europaea SH398 TaxID=1263868 RepID=M5SI50_9BACT|nr:hypothetical protein RESH_03485 [Rhodopirellula europaea SH398]